jgi:hypothetical protein
MARPARNTPTTIHARTAFRHPRASAVPAITPKQIVAIMRTVFPPQPVSRAKDATIPKGFLL